MLHKLGFFILICISLASCSKDKICEEYYRVDLIEIHKMIWVCSDEHEVIDVNGTASMEVDRFSERSGDITIKGGGIVNIGKTQIEVRKEDVLINGQDMSNHITAVIDTNNKVHLGVFVREFD